MNNFSSKMLMLFLLLQGSSNLFADRSADILEILQQEISPLDGSKAEAFADGFGEFLEDENIDGMTPDQEKWLNDSLVFHYQLIQEAPDFSQALKEEVGTAKAFAPTNLKTVLEDELTLEQIQQFYIQESKLLKYAEPILLEHVRKNELFVDLKEPFTVGRDTLGSALPQNLTVDESEFQYLESVIQRGLIEVLIKREIKFHQSYYEESLKGFRSIFAWRRPNLRGLDKTLSVEEYQNSVKKFFADHEKTLWVTSNMESHVRFDLVATSMDLIFTTDPNEAGPKSVLTHTPKNHPELYTVIQVLDSEN